MDRAAQRGAGGQLAPGPQTQRGPHKVNHEYFSKVNFQTLKIFCTLRSQGASTVSFAPGPQNSLGDPGNGC